MWFEARERYKNKMKIDTLIEKVAVGFLIPCCSLSLWCLGPIKMATAKTWKYMGDK